MDLADRLLADYQDALRARESVRVATLRFLRAALLDAQKEARGELTEEQALAVVSRQVKQHRDSIEAYRAGGRDDLVARESAELAILEAYLPPQLGEAELRALLLAAIAESGAAGPGDLGQVMKLVMPQVKGLADGAAVSAAARALLGG